MNTPQTPQGEAAGWIYVIAETGSDYVKIGFAVNTRDRFQSIQVGNPRELQPYYTFKSQRKSEKLIHDFLSEFRARGEWFERSERLERLLELITEAKKTFHVMSGGKYHPETIGEDMDREHQMIIEAEDLVAIFDMVRNEEEEGDELHP